MAVTWAPTVPAYTAAVQKAFGAFGPKSGALFTVRSSASGKRVVTALLTATGTYTTGGDAISPALFGLSRVDEASVNADDAVMVNTNGGFVPAFDLTNPAAPKIKIYSAANTEVAGATNLATKSFVVTLTGY